MWNQQSFRSPAPNDSMQPCNASSMESLNVPISRMKGKKKNPGEKFQFELHENFPYLQANT